MPDDSMEIEFLPESGLFKVTTDPISGPNHVTAEAFIALMASLAGGQVTRSRRTDKQAQAHHHHDQQHTHEH